MKYKTSIYFVIDGEWTVMSKLEWLLRDYQTFEHRNDAIIWGYSQLEDLDNRGEYQFIVTEEKE